MKTTLPLLLMFFILFSATAQIVNIPDPVFKQALLDHGINGNTEIDTNFDGEIQVSEAEALTGLLDVNGQFIDIQDLTGIEAFLNITSLNVVLNQITTLDLSQNTALVTIDCSSNPLQNIDITECLLLEELFSEHTGISQLDLQSNVNLKTLILSDNSIQNLDLTQNSNLEVIGCFNNQHAILDIRNGNNTNIIAFSANSNPDLTCIFVNDAAYMETNFGGNIGSNSTFVETEEECDDLGVNDYQINNIYIYPNPIKDILKIELKLPAKNMHLSVSDILGKELIRKPIFQQESIINLSHFKEGVYFISLYNNTKRLLTKKILKL